MKLLVVISLTVGFLFWSGCSQTQHGASSAVVAAANGERLSVESAARFSAKLANEECEPLLRVFAAQKHQQTDELAAKLHLDVPPEAREFFKAAEAGDWSAVSNRFENIYRRTGPSQVSMQLPSLRNALFIPIHETWGAYATFQEWDGRMLHKFVAGVLDSIPAGSVYFGGTPAGRFLIMAVRDVARSPDVFIATPKFIMTPLRPPWEFIVTQNALVDSLYMSYLRLVYDDKLWVPTETDMQNAFQKYVTELQSRGRQSDESISTNDDGKVQVSGVGGVMVINSIVTKMIFDNNRDKHEFYVEESYVIPWMYPYLEPHGMILKLNKEPLAQLDSAVVVRDREFWGALTEELLANRHFTGNEPSRKTYAKLRSAIGGLYAYRRMTNEAGAAFRQAVALCPDSVEANFRLVQLYTENGRFDDAVAVLEQFQNRLSPSDPDRRHTVQAVAQIRELKRQADKR